MSEKTLQRAVCDYLRFQYPDVLFNSDMAGAMKLTIGQAVQIKSLRSNRGFPDIAIFEPKGKYHGLFIELKKEGEKLTKKDKVTPISDHVFEQMICIEKLNSKGYLSRFAIGFEDAKSIIDWYMIGNF